MSEDVWAGKQVYFTSFWGWGPDTWGTVGFTKEARRNTVIRSTRDPFLVVIYVTKRAPTAGSDTRGKIAGFYEVSHVAGHRDQFTAPVHHQASPDQWQYSLKAMRAFTFLPEYRIRIDDFDPTLKDRAMSVGKNAEELSAEAIERLKHIPFTEVAVYGGPDVGIGNIHVPLSLQNGWGVKSGPANSGRYTVGEPRDTEKELYVLELGGDTAHYLGRPAASHRIFKVGLSMSPKTRLESFRKALPKGTFSWDLFKSTRRDGDAPYPGFDVAEAGETAMKKYLGQLGNGEWLGGEFYAATTGAIERAWKTGRESALAYRRPEAGR